MEMVVFVLLFLLLLAVGISAAATAYFYRIAMTRRGASAVRTNKMSGTSWEQFGPFIREKREVLRAAAKEDVYTASEDGLKLHAVWIPNGLQGRAVICCHGYTSTGMRDFEVVSEYFLRRGFSLLFPDARAHGESEGEYMGFGCLDRYDVRCWILWTTAHCRDTEILLYGHSLGAATVLMAGGLELPPEVKGIAADCPFTSAKDMFTQVLHTMYHLPAFPILPLADAVNRRKAGYGLDDCRADEEVRNIRIPLLLIHGDADTFVPEEMSEQIYRSSPPGTQMLIVHGAGHAQSIYVDNEAYEAALDELLARAFSHDTAREETKTDESSCFSSPA